jgi:hypothetical protein
MGKLHDAIQRHGADQLQLLLEYGDRHEIELARRFLADESAAAFYVHPAVCLTSLPYRALEPDAIWVRENGNVARLTIQPTRTSTGEYLGVPFGPKARMILIYLMTEATRSQSPIVPLGKSMNAWLRLMQIPICGKNYRSVVKQTRRIERCLIEFRYRGAKSESYFQDTLIRRGFQPFSDEDSSVIELSEGFFNALMERPVPVAESAIKLLRDACMPLDIYLWLAFRLRALEQSRILSWHTLHAQFGAECRQLKHFKPKFAKSLHTALSVYPEANVHLVEEGCYVAPSNPPVLEGRPRLVRSPNSTHRLIPSS